MTKKSPDQNDKPVAPQESPTEIIPAIPDPQETNTVVGQSIADLQEETIALNKAATSVEAAVHSQDADTLTELDAITIPDSLIEYEGEVFSNIKTKIPHTRTVADGRILPELTQGIVVDSIRDGDGDLVKILGTEQVELTEDGTGIKFAIIKIEGEDGAEWTVPVIDNICVLEAEYQHISRVVSGMNDNGQFVGVINLEGREDCSVPVIRGQIFHTIDLPESDHAPEEMPHGVIKYAALKFRNGKPTGMVLTENQKHVILVDGQMINMSSLGYGNAAISPHEIDFDKEEFKFFASSGKSVAGDGLKTYTFAQLLEHAHDHFPLKTVDAESAEEAETVRETRPYVDRLDVENVPADELSDGDIPPIPVDPPKQNHNVYIGGHQPTHMISPDSIPQVEDPVTEPEIILRRTPSFTVQPPAGPEFQQPISMETPPRTNRDRTTMPGLGQSKVKQWIQQIGPIDYNGQKYELDSIKSGTRFTNAKMQGGKPAFAVATYRVQNTSETLDTVIVDGKPQLDLPLRGGDRFMDLKEVFSAEPSQSTPGTFNGVALLTAESAVDIKRRGPQVICQGIVRNYLDGTDFNRCSIDTLVGDIGIIAGKIRPLKKVRPLPYSEDEMFEEKDPADEEKKGEWLLVACNRIILRDPNGRKFTQEEIRNTEIIVPEDGDSLLPTNPSLRDGIKIRITRKNGMVSEYSADRLAEESPSRLGHFFKSLAAMALTTGMLGGIAYLGYEYGREQEQKDPSAEVNKRPVDNPAEFTKIPTAPVITVPDAVEAPDTIAEPDVPGQPIGVAPEVPPTIEQINEDPMAIENIEVSQKVSFESLDEAIEKGYYSLITTEEGKKALRLHPDFARTEDAKLLNGGKALPSWPATLEVVRIKKSEE